jgi:serpin B
MNGERAFIRRLTIAVCLLMVFALTACVPTKVVRSEQPRLTPDASDGEIKALVAGNNTFAFDLYQAIRKGEENLLYSPFSISQALAMVYAGARKDTARQMADTLHFTLPQERLHAAFNTLDHEVASRARAAVQDESGHAKSDVAFELHAANAVWGQKGLPYKPEYLAVLAQNYGSGVQLADFKGNPGAAVAEINRWVSQETENRIPEIVSSLSPDTGLVLVNAIYFNAKWALPFKESDTYEEPFHLLDGQQKSVPMMHQHSSFWYAAGDGYQAVELPYLNRTVAMVILLPEDGRFREIEQRLTGEWVSDVVGNLGDQDVILTMPKFTYAPELPLTQILPEMGMPDAFSTNADFSGILDREKYWVYIKEVLHKSFIDVNEQKTEAAAATKVEIQVVEKGIEVGGPSPIMMRVDRPFVFVIHDIKTNTILFVGRVMNPAQ